MVIPLGEPVLVLLVLTPVIQRAVWQCDLVVGAYACFVDLEAVATDCRDVAVRLESNGLQKAPRRIPTGLLRSSPLEPGTPRG